MSRSSQNPDNGLLFLADAYLPHAGGSRVYYHNLLSRIAGHDSTPVTVMTTKVEGWKEFDEREQHDGFRIIRKLDPLPDWRYKRLPAMLASACAGTATCASVRPSLVHFGDLLPQGPTAAWLKTAFRVPVIAYCHGEEVTQTGQRRFQPKLRDYLYRKADAVVAANEFARARLLEIGIDEQRIRKITPGVDCDRFQPKPKNRQLVAKHRIAGKVTLLTVSRLVPRKGHKTVLHAIAALPDRHKLRYLVVGRGPDERELRMLAAELQLEDVVEFVGYVGEEQLPDYYALCDLFLLANEEIRGDLEGFGMVFLEANAAGKPVIGCDSGGASEAIQHGRTGFLIAPQDKEGLTSVLRRLLDEPGLREELGRNGRQRARDDFNWDDRAESLRDLNAKVMWARRKG